MKYLSTLTGTRWYKEYKIFDHLGNVRSVLRKGLNDNSYTITSQYDYDAWGGVIWSSGNNERAKYIGKETDNESGDHNHGVRQYSDYVGRFLCPDGLWAKYVGWTPYQYAENNPINYFDANGLNWFRNGQTKGLKWFDQQGDFSETKNENTWIDYGKDKPPDADGYLTLNEANKWYREGKGLPLFVDLSKIDLSKVSKEDFPKGIGTSEYVNLASFKYLSNINDGVVYGSIKLTYIGDNKVTSKKDKYDFDMQKWSLNTAVRNVETMLASMIAGQGKPFDIYFLGIGNIGKK